MSPYDVTQIIRTVLEEWEGESVKDEEAFIDNVKLSLQNDLSAIEQYSAHSTPLSLVRFQCMLQDTGYPLEVYAESGNGQNMSSGTSNLKERWIGWGVEVPGQSRWASNVPIESAAASLSLHTSSEPNPHPMAIKFPLPEKQSSYLGAMITIYDESITFPPASVHTFVGILSRTGLPSVDGELGSQEVEVPALHVLAGPLSEQEMGDVDERSRVETLDYLSSLVGGDKVAGEYLLLNLLSRPSIRPNGLPPLGTLSLNLIYPDTTHRLNPQDLSLIAPRVVHLPLTISSLHSDVFTPSSPASVSLDSGILQLPPDTFLVVDETHLGEGGKLEERAIKNLQALQGCLNEQKVPYNYPYMPDLKMECSIKGLILSEGGRGIVRADVSLPVEFGGDLAQRPTGEKLDRIRTFLLACGSKQHATKLVIPDEVGNVIQDAFVSMRSEGAKGEDAEATLKRRMRIARLLAISHSTAVLDKHTWKRASSMDQEAQRRLSVKAVKQ